MVHRCRIAHAPTVPRAACVVALVATLAAGAEPALPASRVAILAAAAQQGLADLLTAELSQERNLTLVERAAIDRVLSELSLSAAQAGGGDEGVKLGSLLAADGILFCEPEPQSEPPQVRLTLVETRSGIRLGDWPVPAAEIAAGDMAEVFAGLRQATAKLGVPPGNRHLIGMIGIQPEVATTELTTLARAVTVLVERDLAALPDVVVLDREQLQRLTSERDLTGLEIELKASSKLVDGGVRRDGDRLAVTLKLTSRKGGASRVAEITSAMDLASVRLATFKAITGLVDAEPAALTALPDAATESAQFAARARRLGELEAHAEAIRLAETAYALAPGRDTFQVASDVYDRAESALASGSATRELRPEFSRPWFTHDLYPTGEAVRIARLELLVRWSELLRDFYERCVHEPKLEAEFPTWCPVLFGRRLVPTNDAERRLAADHNRIARATYDRILAARRAAGGSGAAELILRRLNSVRDQLVTTGPCRGEALIRFLREIEVEIAREEAAGRLPSAQDAGPHLRWLPDDRAGFDAMYHDFMLDAVTRASDPPPSAAELQSFLESLAASDVAALRLVGWSRLLEFPGEPGAVAAERFLDTLFSGAVPRAPRPLDPGRPGFDESAHKAAQRLANAGRLRGVVERLLATAEADQDLSRLLEWPTALSYVIGSDRQQAEAFAARVDALLATRAYAAKVKPAADFYRERRALLRALDTRTGPFAPAKAGGLDGYEVHQLPIATPEPGFRHLAMVHVDRTPEGDPRRPLVLVWAKHAGRPLWREQDDPHDFEYLISRSGTDGGAWHGESRCQLPIKVIHLLASAGDRHGFATEQGVALVTDRGLTTIGEAEGLPAGWISAMAWHDGQLYVACENTLVAVTPDKPNCAVIASARSVTSRNPLDGVGSFTITGLAADPRRERLVVLVTSNQPPERSPAGLWSFTPQTGAWRRLAPGGCFGLVWGKEALFYGRRDSQNEVPYCLDLASSRITPLPGYAKDALPYVDQRQPGWTIFDNLLFFPMSTQAAARDAAGREHSWGQGSGCTGSTIHRVGDELVVFDESASRLWVIRRKKSKAGQDQAP